MPWIKKIFVLFFLLSFGLLGAKEGDRPRICLNMIVKNEKDVIERCLNSVKPLIDCWVIVDTGSKDGTQEIIRECMRGIPGVLYERPWVNFAHNRNEALDYAKESAEYLLFMDADDILEFSPFFERPFLDKDAYTIKIRYDGNTYSRFSVVKSALDWRWRGVVHEVIDSQFSRTYGLIEGVEMVIIGGGDRSQDPTKFLKDALLLETALKEDPYDARNVFYLAQSYRCAGIPDLALKNYLRRVELMGWDQEVFWSLYSIALLYEELSFSKEKIIDAYYEAFHYRPIRAEPLYRLAAYYRRQNDFLLAYLLTEYALKIPLPFEVIFVERWIYEYGLLFEHSISAYWVEKYEECYNACLKLLSLPNLPISIREATLKNIEFAKEKLVTVGAL
jgi:glycosyltransferase involved in cell wall biosynthesis